MNDGVDPFYVVLDRDGILNMDVGYTHLISDFQLPEGTVEGLQRLRELGARFVVATGQSGIARGKYAIADMEQFNQHLQDQLSEHGIVIEAVAYCPHHPEHSGDCACRKPKTGMLDQLEQQVGSIDWSQAWGIGDKPSDAQMILQKKGARSILVKSGPQNNSTGESYWTDEDDEVRELQRNPRNFFADSITEAAMIIVEHR